MCEKAGRAENICRVTCLFGSCLCRPLASAHDLRRRPAPPLGINAFRCLGSRLMLWTSKLRLTVLFDFPLSAHFLGKLFLFGAQVSDNFARHIAKNSAIANFWWEVCVLCFYFVLEWKFVFLYRSHLVGNFVVLYLHRPSWCLARLGPSSGVIPLLSINALGRLGSWLIVVNR